MSSRCAEDSLRISWIKKDDDDMYTFSKHPYNIKVSRGIGPFVADHLNFEPLVTMYYDVKNEGGVTPNHAL